MNLNGNDLDEYYEQISNRNITFYNEKEIS